MSDSEPLDLVELHVARTPFEAQVIGGVLRSAGVPCYVGGTQLNDEFAASQRLANLQTCDITVLRSDLDRAKEALAEAKRAGELLEQMESDGEGDSDGGNE